MDGFAAAIVAAKSCDTVIVTLGLWFNKHGDANEGEGHDRAAIELPGHQGDLVAAIRTAVGPSIPVVGLLIHGGTLALGAAGEQLDAILSAWYPGLEGGHAIAETLFGDWSPAGRTPVTWYTSTDVLPPPGEMDESAGGGVTYRYIKDYKNSVVYPFGFGLSYTTFSYANLVVNVSTIQPCGAIGLTVTVANTGTVDSDEVVQVYIKTPDAPVPAPRVRLVAFERVFVPAKSAVTVNLVVTPDAYAFVTPNPADIYKDTRTVGPGSISLYVGGGQPDYYADTLAANVKITGATVPLAQCK
jgi:beta-glucosidase